jgi:hypothetical protein
MKVKFTGGKPRSIWEERLRKDVTQKEGGTRFLDCERKETEVGVWLSDDTFHVEMY